ncbi:hypothetical protein [Sphingobium subterraneum]|uniref:DUF2946 domain-containing protein n=1 Tax=Sphingobium subterraneum TaxID=627688 RepID=A0A841J4H2_9SPHN|nr:hypothetical protein [Sphingobium subterraneum]MBB6124416.1 hypothetical protein [Sphingobium subterraneum]
MTGLRIWTRQQRWLAMMIMALALCVKAIVPTGYMVGSGERTLVVQLCSDGLSKAMTTRIAIPMAPMSQHQQDKQRGGDSPCAFGALSMGALGGVDAPLLADALLFIVARGFAPVVALPLERLHHVRPPLRGPPASF